MTIAVSDRTAVTPSPALDPASARTDAHLALEGVVKRYKGQEVAAVQGVDLRVPRGEFFALLGPSGCGKTTTLNMIAGFVQPTEGALYLSGRRLDHMPAHKRGTAMVFQDYGMIGHLTARQNVEYGLRVRRVRRAARVAKAEELLETVGLAGFGDRYPSQLSGGQRQRVALARALAIEPEIVLLDEPLSGLDERLRHQVRAELNRVLRGSGVTVVLVTHDQAEAFSMCDRVGVMLQGRLETAATPDELYRSPVNEKVARFVGESTFASARIVERTNRGVLCEITVGDQQARIETRVSGASAEHIAAGLTGEVQWRPEWLRFVPAGEGHLTGVVADRAFYGSYVDYHVDVGGVRVLVRRLAGDHEQAPGDRVGLESSPGDGLFHLAEGTTS